MNSVIAQKITIQGTKFYRDGQEIWFNGANTPWDNWNDFGGNYNHQWWDTAFKYLQRAHINMTRIWISCSGEVAPTIDSSGTVTGVIPAFWSDVDDLERIANKYQIYVLSTMMSFDNFENNHPDSSSWRKMISDSSKVRTYINNYLVPYVQRYDSSNYFYAIDLCNEPEWINQNAAEGKLPVSYLQRFAAMCASAVHKNSSKLVTIGSASVKWNSSSKGSQFVANWWSDANLKDANNNDSTSRFDFWQTHYYDWMYPYYGAPFTKTLVSFGMTTDRPTLVGEGPGKNDEGYSIIQMYQYTWTNGFAGYCSWTSNGVDGNGILSDFEPGTDTFFTKHMLLVYPSNVPASGIKVSPVQATIAKGQTLQLTGTVIPQGASQAVAWSSSDTSIARVNIWGMVTALEPGSVIITATSAEGGFTTTSDITVYSGTAIETKENDAASIIIYPNPLNITCSPLYIKGLTKGSLELTLSDIEGRIIYTDKSFISESVYSLSLGNITNGYYNLRIINNGLVFTKKLII